MDHSCRRVCGGANVCLDLKMRNTMSTIKKNDGKEAKRLQEKKIAQSNSVNERKNKRMNESRSESVNQSINQ